MGDPSPVPFRPKGGRLPSSHHRCHFVFFLTSDASSLPPNNLKSEFGRPYVFFLTSSTQRLEQHRREIALMLRSSEFNQDKTALIVTNNPFPLLVSGQHLTTPFQYFPKDLSRRVRGLGPFPWQKNGWMEGWMDEGEGGREEENRFTNKKDFKGEARFSKNYAERRLQRLYPQLHLHSRLGKLWLLHDSKELGNSYFQWEPLTLSCLTEMKPTFIVPGEDGFRHGNAPLWIVNNSVVLNSP
uniref:Uncharacterized protein n=1 Tax=Pseudonaja textilis TaxID=8673 RepID=A0A670ZTI1_PSETE